MKKILFAFVSLLVAAGVQAQKTHPDISSVLVSKHMPTYYVFYAWSKLCGNQCDCVLEGGEVVYCHLTDDRHNYTEIPLFPAEDGTVRVRLCNNSIAIVEF